MKVLQKDSEKFLQRYLDNHSPTGYEASGQQIWLDYIRQYVDDWSLDNYGTAYGVVNPGKDYRVVIEAHADEISWFVHYITKDGFIYVAQRRQRPPDRPQQARQHPHAERHREGRVRLAGDPRAQWEDGDHPQPGQHLP